MTHPTSKYTIAIPNKNVSKLLQIKNSCRLLIKECSNLHFMHYSDGLTLTV